jgi:S1-C subfamily serine protease
VAIDNSLWPGEAQSASALQHGAKIVTMNRTAPVAGSAMSYGIPEMSAARQTVRSTIGEAGSSWASCALARAVLLALWACIGPALWAGEPEPNSRADSPARVRFRTGRPTLSPGRSGARLDQRVAAAFPSDDWTFRPTVIIRRGTSQGSGTIIASLDDETLVLTASHVVKGDGPIHVELHRYNIGLERTKPGPGWPRSLPASLAARDPAADLAILRIEKMVALPHVARLAPTHQQPGPDTVVTSIGFDLGIKLMSWSSLLVETLWFELNDSHDERSFLITARAPEHGRSGGGLFLQSGELVGVCVGHAELIQGHPMGIFASGESIRQLLLESNLLAVVSRSELRRTHHQGTRATLRSASTTVRAPSDRAVTPTRATNPDQQVPP